MNSTLISFHQSPSSASQICSKSKHHKHIQSNKFISSFSKLQKIFAYNLTKSTNQSNSHNLSQNNPISQSNKNISCINLGVDDQYIYQPFNINSNHTNIHQNNPQRYSSQRSYLPSRHQKRFINTVSFIKNKLYKRVKNHSQSSSNKKFTLFLPNQQKQKLQIFQKKLQNCLEKRKTQQKSKTDKPYLISKPYFAISRFKQQITKDKNDQIQGRKTFKGVFSNQVINKWKNIAQNIRNQKQKSSINISSNLDYGEIVYNSNKQISHRHLKNNTVLQEVLTDQKSRLQKNIKTKNKQNKSILKQNYERSKIISTKLKFKKIDILNYMQPNQKHLNSIYKPTKNKLNIKQKNKNSQKQNMNQLINYMQKQSNQSIKFNKQQIRSKDYQIRSKDYQIAEKKLSRLLKSRKSCPINTHSQYITRSQFTPWQSTPTQKSINIIN